MGRNNPKHQLGQEGQWYLGVQQEASGQQVEEVGLGSLLGLNKATSEILCPILGPTVKERVQWRVTNMDYNLEVQTIQWNLITLDLTYMSLRSQNRNDPRIDIKEPAASSANEKILLDGIPSLRCVNYLTQLGVICQIAKYALDPIIFVTEDMKRYLS
ncbi:hypothetical protein TURU_144232 [Turdus rufiventris]|nr:hypothetical protein TURU_144232 [Turdus rufiventris]